MIEIINCAASKDFKRSNFGKFFITLPQIQPNSIPITIRLEFGADYDQGILERTTTLYSRHGMRSDPQADNIVCA